MGPRVLAREGQELGPEAIARDRSEHAEVSHFGGSQKLGGELEELERSAIADR